MKFLRGDEVKLRIKDHDVALTGVVKKWNGPNAIVVTTKVGDFTINLKHVPADLVPERRFDS